jgi:glycosyltransferase involved in cell wall biosynthesis
MFTSHPALPWEKDWMKAAATQAEVVWISEARELTWPTVPGMRFLARAPDEPRHYQVRVPHWRPSRVLGRLARRVTMRRSEAAVRHIIRAHGPVDVMHSHSYWMSYLPRLRRRLGIPYVVTEHATAWQGHSAAPPPSALGLRRARELYRHAACVLAVCESLRQRLTESGLPGNFRVLHNPVDSSGFPDPVAAPPTTEIQVVSVGRLRPAKGFDVLLEALAIARNHDPRLRLTIVGGGEEQAALEGLRSRLGLDAVEFLGPRSHADVVAALRRAHVFALASRAENLTVAVIEALCVGLPVVVTDVGGHRELVDDRLGRLVPSEDPSAFAEALLEVVAALDRFDRGRIAAETRERFSISHVGAQLADVYAATVQQPQLAMAPARPSGPRPRA